jgi:hypothetical protein
VKICLKGCRFILGVRFGEDFVSAATQAEPSPADAPPPTIGSLGKFILSMPKIEFEEHGGFWALLRPGEGIEIPPSHMLVEFTTGSELNTTVTYPVVHNTMEYVEESRVTIELALRCCNRPALRPLEQNLQARLAQ